MGGDPRRGRIVGEEPESVLYVELNSGEQQRGVPCVQFGLPSPQNAALSPKSLPDREMRQQGLQTISLDETMPHRVAHDLSAYQLETWFQHA